MTAEAHKHCKQCDLSIHPDDKFCSKKCESEFDDYRGKQRWKWGLLFIFATAMIVLSIFSRF